MSDNGNKPDEKKEDDLPTLVEQIPTIIEPRCKVCQSDFRDVIDRLIVTGISDTKLAQQFAGKDASLKSSVGAVRKSIERHRKRHLNVRDSALRRILEKRAAEAGILVDRYEDQLVDTTALLEQMIAKGQEQITDPKARIKYQDVIKAAEMLRDQRLQEASEQMEVYARQVRAISQAVKELVPLELHPAIVDRARQLLTGEFVEVGAGQQAQLPKAEEVEVIDA